MIISKVIFRLRLLSQEIELLTIFAWLLFYPTKTSYFYFLSFAVLINFFIIKNIIFGRNIGFSTFSYWLIAVNSIFFFLILFSNYKQRSILFFWDILLLSIYFLVFYFDDKSKKRFFMSISYCISLLSLLTLINKLMPFSVNKNFFFENPILQGVMSGIGVLICLFYLIECFRWTTLVFLVANGLGVYVSSSKAAFLGVIIFAILILLRKQKKLILILLVLIVLTFIIPNPIGDSVNYSIKHDPYALDRIHIWGMCFNIFLHNWVTGVGLDNFAEVSSRYNFKQTKGPANYFKRARQSHNDYLKLIAENGVGGGLILIFSLFFLIRKLTAISLAHPAVIILLYMLFQAFFINIIFAPTPVFLFIFLLALKNLYIEKLIFKSLNTNFKIIFIGLMIVVLTIGYILPFMAKRFTEKARDSHDIVRKLSLLQVSERLNPLEVQTYYFKSQLFFRLFQSTFNLSYFSEALKNLKRGQRLNPYQKELYELEYDLYIEVMKRKFKYLSLDEEILQVLEKSEEYHPFDPFLKFKKALIYYEFGKKELAKAEALNALELEPEFVLALYFLHKNYNHFRTEGAFRGKIEPILKKARILNPKRGSYLFSLYEVPKL